jgi:crotonobetaine/carnitine-CoA ligase
MPRPSAAGIETRPARRWSYAGLVEEKAALHGDRTFAQFGEQRVSYASLDARSNAVGNSLRDLGVAPGEKVAVMLPNCPEFLDVWFATEKIGATMVPVNISLKGDGLRYIISHSDSVVAVVHEQVAGPFLDIRHDVGAVRDIIVTGNVALVEDARPYADLLTGSQERPEHRIREEDMVAILYTSGTTGPPKGVVHRQGRVRFAQTFADLVGYGRDDILYTFLPLFHANAQVLTIGVALCSDASVAVDPSFTASGFWDRTRVYGATVFNYIGGVLQILYSQPPREDDRDNPIRFCLGPGAPAAIWEEFEERFGVRIVEFWSSTEGGLTFNGFEGRIGSIGKPVHEYNEVKVVDDRDQECPSGVVGELVSRFAEEGKRLEYYKMPEATSEKTRAGWLRSGDLGYRDEDGYYFYVDRAKDSIRRRGENISSWEVETVANKHPAIAECAAYGVPSEVGEEEVMVAIRLNPGSTFDPPEFLRWCEERMAYYMVPRYVRFVDGFEKTETHRIQKTGLKREGVTDDTWDRQAAGYEVRR